VTIAGALCVPSGCSSAKKTAPPPPVPAGQWGTSCLPGGGEQNNPACDSAAGFACYGSSPTDANSLCTRFDCATGDCRAGWWCATVNQAPNVTTDKATFGPTRPVCLPRTYCSPCQTDSDCPATADGVAQHCATDTKGAGYCTVECGNASNCALDATCAKWESLCTPSQGAACKTDDDCRPTADRVAQHCETGQCTPECGADSDCSPAASAPAQTCQEHRLCAPRAGVCVGTGGFCSPCHSDGDCTKGFCLSSAPYSTERFCSLTATVSPCDTTTLDPPGCPAFDSSDNWAAIACVSTPPNQCEGLVIMGSASGEAMGLPGCWTVNR
jgi:hypothetical protein